MSDPHTASRRLLAFDTSTDTLSVAVGVGGRGADAVWAEHTAPGGAQASATLIPIVLDLLARVGWRLDELDAIVFGRGPGAFTGVRTACAVAQGLAFAARPGGVPVLPLDTLAAVAEQGRAVLPDQALTHIAALMDARMDEIYVASYRLDGEALVPEAPARLCRPEDLHAAVRLRPGLALAGNAMAVYGRRLPPDWQALPQAAVLPGAAALLRLAPAALQAGQAVDAAQAQPLYVRDKVALTTAERAAAAAAATAGAAE